MVSADPVELDELPVFERMLACVRMIPSGKVMSYGDVAEFAGIRGARQVGRLLARAGADLPWHRVLRVDGSCAPHLRERQLSLLAAERVPICDGRVVMARARWDGR